MRYLSRIAPEIKPLHEAGIEILFLYGVEYRRRCIAGKAETGELDLNDIATVGIGLFDLPAAIWPALARSLLVAGLCTALTMVAALLLAAAIVRGRFARLLELTGMLPLAASSLVLGTGLFLILHPVMAVERLSLPVTALVNATLALPFVLRIILPALRKVEADFGGLATSLGLNGAARWRWLILPRLRVPLGFAAGLVAALSIGDLGVVALFAGERGVTLPLLVQRLMGAYRMDAAAGAALVLVSVSFAVFWLLDRGGRRLADA